MKDCMRRIYEDFKKNWVMAAAIVFVLIGINFLFHATCPSIVILGLPCPGCGMTRALTLLVTGHPVLAFRMNPSIYVWLLFFAYIGYYRYIKGKKIKYFSGIFIMVIGITILVYFGGMRNSFPLEPPYIIVKDNLLARIFPSYVEFLTKMQ